MIEEKKQKHYLIYQTTNLVNGKIYIGKHETFNIEDNYFGSGNLIVAAIKKYGIENFEFKILIDLKSREEMNLLEKMVVTEEFCAREDVYNIKVGGEGGWDYINRNALLKNKSTHNGGQATKKFLQSLSLDEYKLFMYKRSLIFKKTISNQSILQRLETSNKISDGLKKYYKSHQSPRKGAKHSIESRKKMSLAASINNRAMVGKIWICNDLTHKSKVILKTDPIPDGWRKGRICK